jgi:hypothetical protein
MLFFAFIVGFTPVPQSGHGVLVPDMVLMLFFLVAA